MLRQAHEAMLSGRPGPVNLDVPLNVFAEPAPTGAPGAAAAGPGTPPRSAAAGDDVDRAIELLLAAERPVIVVGAGAADGAGDASDVALLAEELAAFAAAAGIPVVSSPAGKDLASGSSGSSGDRYLGPSGRNGTLQANRATRSADVVLALGTRFDDRSTSSWLDGYTYAIPPARLIHVHGDAAEIGRNYPAEVGIDARVSLVLRQLHRALLSRRSSGDPRARPDSPARARWLSAARGWRDEWERHVAPSRASDSVPLHPARVLAELRAALPSDGILLSDVGAHHNWIVQEWESGGPGTLLQSWGFAAMGFGVAGALGARLAAPSRAVAAVVGDGGFLMLPSVVATAVQYDLPAVWIVWNNGGFISIRDQQRGYFGPEIATSFTYAASGEPYRCDFAALARSMGADGMRAQTPGDLGAALKTALYSGRPTVIDVPVDAEVPQPAVATWELPPLPHPAPAFGWPDLLVPSSREGATDEPLPSHPPRIHRHGSPHRP
jgi:acetolactate synthase-1/2/3 large subunit